MGPVTISFVTESSDFQNKRLQRLETVGRAREAVKSDPKNVKESGNKKAVKKQNGSQPSNDNLEDGEVSDEDSNGTERSQDVTTRRKEDANEAEGSRDVMVRRKEDSRRRSRSSSRSRSPNPSKRKRSPSNVDAERHYLRNRPNERGPPQRARKPRTPVKSSRYRNIGNSHFNSRSNRR